MRAIPDGRKRPQLHHPCGAWNHATIHIKGSHSCFEIGFTTESSGRAGPAVCRRAHMVNGSLSSPVNFFAPTQQTSRAQFATPGAFAREFCDSHTACRFRFMTRSLGGFLGTQSSATMHPPFPHKSFVLASEIRRKGWKAVPGLLVPIIPLSLTLRLPYASGRHHPKREPPVAALGSVLDR